MKNSADLRGCYPPRPLASVDNTLLDLQNSSYITQSIANYFMASNFQTKIMESCDWLVFYSTYYYHGRFHIFSLFLCFTQVEHTQKF